MEKKLEQKPSDIVKIVLFGPECSGKTTLSKELSKKYKTLWVPEFARNYLQKKWDKQRLICEEKDIMPIAKGQIHSENHLTPKAHKILFCDTNILETKVYAEQYFKNYKNPTLEKAVKNLQYDLYFLTDVDIPYEKDDLRDRPNQRSQCRSRQFFN